jgi:hypothetical protein
VGDADQVDAPVDEFSDALEALRIVVAVAARPPSLREGLSKPRRS